MTRRNALQSTIDGTRSGRRPQRVYTPPVIAHDLLGAVWPEGVACDPCSGPDSLVEARLRVMPPFNGCRYATKIPTGEYDEDGRAIYTAAPPGLPVWPARTFFNPEFNFLDPWLRQFVESDETIGLVPVRTHRRWWRSAILRPDVVRAWLDPLCFVGHAQSFPLPLVLAYRGARAEVFAAEVSRLGIGEVR